MPGVPHPGTAYERPGGHRLDVPALRAFLIKQGYHIADTGDSIGPHMKSALADFVNPKHIGGSMLTVLQGMHITGRRNPDAWNKEHGVPYQKMDMNPNASRPNREPSPINPGDTTKQTQAVNQARAADKNAGVKNLPKHGTPPNSPKGMPHVGGPTGGPGAGPIDFSSMLAGLLGKSNTSKMLPLSLADQAASPYTSQAATFADQISRLPAAKQQALQNISDWFGQVQKAEKHGAAQDQSLANAGAASMQDATKGIMASLGGSAMAGSGEVGAVGANDANTMTAIGANDAALADELAPIFKLSEANAKNTRSQQYDNQLSDLQDQQGQAQGQADAARAAAVMQILQSNNQSRQANFGNASGLLNTLAGLQISGANAASQAQSRQIENMFRLSEIQKNQRSGSGNPLDAMTPSQRAAFADKITQGITSGKLSWPDALRAARNSARTAGLNPFGNQVIQSIIGPALANAGITGPGGGFWPAVYKR